MRQKSTSAGAWSLQEDDFLRDNYRQYTHQQLSNLMGRTVNAVRNRCSELSLRRASPHWTDADIAMLRQWYAERDGKPLELDVLASRLGRHKTNVCRKARELGLSDHRRTRVEKIDGRWPCEVPKYATDDERRAAMSVVRKRLIAENGHPRGMLGKKHSAETRKRLREAVRERYASETPEHAYERGRKAAMTRLKRYGTAGPVYAVEENAYSRARGGKRADLDNRYFRSAWEANYARYLRWLMDQGEIQAWEYEPDTFVFHGETRGAIHYTPDFKVTERDGSVVYHEIKGWMDSKSKTKLKRMKKHYPDIRVVVIGEGEYKAIAKWKGMIPEWE